jgi:hypothetical protein
MPVFGLRVLGEAAVNRNAECPYEWAEVWGAASASIAGATALNGVNRNSVALGKTVISCQSADRSDTTGELVTEHERA